ncbi:hypothetical protein [Hymenobacter aerophilus]|uniref:hypothetical protein n=1 Tax=Hymenobacter aerophilus TaxID=119644 RepID=UPI0003A80A83|nr:hypothetical protein [Hymenobacter aerophilus]
MMNTLLSASASEIDFWSDQPAAKAQLPEVIRRLVLATAPRLSLVDFPGGSSVYEGGWDGITQDITGTVFVPEGTAGWEIGTSPVTYAKAKSDYDKRTAKSLGLVPGTTTFVLVTSRNWPAPAKRQFVSDRQAEKIWKEVRVYDAKDLEAWLTTAPAVHYWFAHLLGKRPANVTDLETYWLDWAAETTPPTPAALLTLGRLGIVREIHTWLKGPEKSLGIQADSRSEALAMFAAALQELPENERLGFFARCIVVHTVEAWRELVASYSTLLLVPLFNDHSVISSALRQGHRVVVPLDRADTNWKNEALELPRLPRLETSELLRTLAISPERADALAGIARRSFAAFRRALTEHAHGAKPKWVHTAHQDILIAALLVGTWDEQKEEDKAVVVYVAAAADYAQVKSQLVQWLAVPDPPVRLVGSTWFIVDKGDVWSLLAAQITPEQLGRFTQTTIHVLGSIPPRYNLPREEWYRASLLDKEPPYSSKLQESLATTLAFLGSLEDFLPVAGEPASHIADQLVSQLLLAANADWRIWSALANNLQWLAEAAPGAFLQAVQDGLRGESPPVMQLFETSQNFFGPSTDYPGLLWALETLAWSPDYLLPVTLLLGELSRRAPEPPLVNRPINSLREVFLLWYPHTAASLEQRLQVLDVLQQREPEVGDQLLRTLSPKAHSVSSGTNKPRWRDWVPSRNVTRREVYEATLAIQERLLRNAHQDIDRWESIIEDLPEVPYEQQAEVIAQLRALSQEVPADADRIRLRDKTREVVSRHRSFADADWAMLPARVDELAAVMELFEPADITAKYLWLFNDWPLLPEGREGDTQAYQILIGERQRQALYIIYEQGGLDALVSLIPLVISPQTLGRILGQTDIVSETQALYMLSEYLKSDTESEAVFALGLGGALISLRTEVERHTWAESVLAAHEPDWPAIKQAEWLRLLPANPRTWQAVSRLASEGQQYYWDFLPYFFVSDEDTEQGIKLFLAHNHITKAIELLGQRMYQGQVVSTDLATEALEMLLRERPAQRPASHKVDTILGKLAEASDADRERVIKLEFALLSDSFSLRQSKRTPLIFQELNANPGLFVDLVARVYRPKNTEPRVLTEEESRLNIASWRLLNAWRGIPGTDKTGRVDQQHLTDWVALARKLLLANGREKIGDEQIGQILSGSPIGADGAWPHEAVRALLEKVASPDIERGFMIGHYNSRGTTSRSPYEGGEQERELVKQYLSYAEVVKTTSYRTAEILRKMAQKYEREAVQEDNEASLNQDLYQ